MRRTIRRLLIGLFLLVVVSLLGQSPSQSPAVNITLGQTAPLYGPWKFTVVGSLIDPKTGTALWAELDSDDFQSETVDLKLNNYFARNWLSRSVFWCSDDGPSWPSL